MATSKHLKIVGISAQDTQKYVANAWLESLGRGSFKRPQETITWQGALYSVQTQLGLPIHAGGLTALELSGQSHYLRFTHSTAYVFSPPATALPQWFKTHWGDDVRHIQTKLLPSDIGLTERQSVEGFTLKSSTLERAILELLYLAPKQFDLIEASQILEGLTSLRPKLMQTLLQECQSIKVKRLFLYLAERAQLPVMDFLDLSTIDLGKGDRSLSVAGRYVSKYQLLLPKELVDNGR